MLEAQRVMFIADSIREVAMEKLTLYRGISVEPEHSEEMESRIFTYGLTQGL